MSWQVNTLGTTTYLFNLSALDFWEGFFVCQHCSNNKLRTYEVIKSSLEFEQIVKLYSFDVARTNLDLRGSG